MSMTAVPSLHVLITNVDENTPNVRSELRSSTLGGREASIFAETDRIAPNTIEITGIAPGNYQLALQTYGKGEIKPETLRSQAINISGEGEIDLAKTATLLSVTGLVTFEGAAK